MKITTAEAAALLCVSRQRAALIVRSLPGSVLLSRRFWLAERAEVEQWAVDHAESRRFSQEIQRRAKSLRQPKIVVDT